MSYQLSPCYSAEISHSDVITRTQVFKKGVNSFLITLISSSTEKDQSTSLQKQSLSHQSTLLFLYVTSYGRKPTYTIIVPRRISQHHFKNNHFPIKARYYFCTSLPMAGNPHILLSYREGSVSITSKTITFPSKHDYFCTSLPWPETHIYYYRTEKSVNITSKTITFPSKHAIISVRHFLWPETHIYYYRTEKDQSTSLQKQSLSHQSTLLFLYVTSYGRKPTYTIIVPRRISQHHFKNNHFPIKARYYFCTSLPMAGNPHILLSYREGSVNITSKTITFPSKHAIISVRHFLWPETHIYYYRTEKDQSTSLQKQSLSHQNAIISVRHFLWPETHIYYYRTEKDQSTSLQKQSLSHQSTLLFLYVTSYGRKPTYTIIVPRRISQHHFKNNHFPVKARYYFCTSLPMAGNPHILLSYREGYLYREGSVNITSKTITFPSKHAIISVRHFLWPETHIYYYRLNYLSRIIYFQNKRIMNHFKNDYLYRGDLELKFAENCISAEYFALFLTFQEKVLYCFSYYSTRLPGFKVKYNTY
ncbi:hypothetical protein CDAR_374681 [Caerostris darwini]|uniref:Uncharacterized protein n=1 Tax=Caerostris darwini TaxID=1538125 RepID=A0AAV4P985_9ARAC|nr:hypothetical protein CDAR_374681 [Caerostris darwini]